MVDYFDVNQFSWELGWTNGWFTKFRGALGHVVLLQVALQRGQLPRAAAADDVLLREARGEDANHDLVGPRSCEANMEVKVAEQVVTEKG